MVIYGRIFIIGCIWMQKMFRILGPAEEENQGLCYVYGGVCRVLSWGEWEWFNDFSHSLVYPSWYGSLTHWSAAAGGMMWLKCKWLSECRIACQPEALRGTASHHVWLQNGLYTLPFFPRLVHRVCLKSTQKLISLVFVHVCVCVC